MALSSPADGAPAALRQLAGLVARPRVLGALAAFWALLWAGLALGYDMTYKHARPAQGLDLATFDAGLWTLQAAAAFAGGWLIIVNTRPTPRQVGAIVALASVLVAVRMPILTLAAGVLELSKLSQSGMAQMLVHYYPRHMLVITSCVAAGAALRYVVRGWERAAELSALEQSIARTRLETLRNRVSPGLLLRSLDTISHTMEDAPRAADALLVRVSELLRGRLVAAALDEVPLREELALARLYAQVSQGCGRRPVRLCVDAPAGLDRWRVPPCTVGWPVEVALQAAGEGAHPAQLHVRVRECAGELRVEVVDDLPVPLARRVEGAEWRLVEALGDQLRHRYGDGEWLRAADREPAGVEVRVRIPAGENAAAPAVRAALPAEVAG